MSLRDDDPLSIDEMAELEQGNSSSHQSKKGIFTKLRRMTPRGRRRTVVERNEDERRRVFKIPGKVRDRKHFITDELTELTSKACP